jgi:hypothetical protein
VGFTVEVIHRGRDKIGKLRCSGRDSLDFCNFFDVVDNQPNRGDAGREIVLDVEAMGLTEGS